VVDNTRIEKRSIEGIERKGESKTPEVNRIV
jgi:hypothetical protein